MNESDIIDLLKESNALLSGHFILTSGLHSPNYIEKFRLLEQPRITEKLCKQIADRFLESGITVVVGPMTGGIILAYEVGKSLNTKSIFTERVEGKMQFKRGFSLNKGDKVLIVEDIITTGGSVIEVINAVKKMGAAISAIACIVDRSQGKAKFDYDFFPLLKIDVINYEQKDCPLCKKNIPVIKPGSTNK